MKEKVVEPKKGLIIGNYKIYQYDKRNFSIAVKTDDYEPRKLKDKDCIRVYLSDGYKPMRKYFPSVEAAARWLCTNEAEHLSIAEAETLDEFIEKLDQFLAKVEAAL